MKRLEIETKLYNERRYSKPWAANVSVVDDKLTYSFGQWIGEPGHAGLLILDVTSKVYARGQRDNRARNGYQGNTRFYDSQTDEEITRVEAFKLLSKMETV